MQTNPQTAAANWAAAMQSAGAKATAGVNAVTTNPMQLAVQAIPRQVQGVIDAANSGKTAAGLGSVTLQAWQKAYITKGVPRMGTGAQAAQGKMAAFMTQLLPAQAAIIAALPPRGNTAQNIARSQAFLQAMAQFRYQLAGS